MPDGQSAFSLPPPPASGCLVLDTEGGTSYPKQLPHQWFDCTMVTWWGYQGHWKESGQFPNSCFLLVVQRLLVLLGGLSGRKRRCSLDTTRGQRVLKVIGMFPIGCCGEGVKTPYGARSVSYHLFAQNYPRAFRVLSVRIGRAGIEVPSHCKWGKWRQNRVGEEMIVYSALCCRH